ncbi:FAD-dependent monooxygenase [Mucilaginibacter sp. CSA2-8R]|uniref:FAD-dependent monooxygenase n=1 Tax=Mucilaginibacter sp. CSA2-8R TaxID=3141542 RepID=UPI00315D0EAF
MSSPESKSVLISGASIAGLTAACLMQQLGYRVTVVEQADQLRIQGSAVNLTTEALEVAKRIGIYQALNASALKLEKWEFKDAGDTTVGQLPVDAADADEEVEIERGKLLQLLTGALKEDITFIFGDRITRLQENPEEVEVSFRNYPSQTFQLVLGADGSHSGVRKIWFGPEADYTHFLNHYFSITIVPKLLIPQGTAQMYNVPGKVVMLNAYNGKTDICFCFYSAQLLDYDYRNTNQQRHIIEQHFATEGWRTPELLQEISRAETAYFDQFSQVRMPYWTKGRVALVGDAAYCASPAAGIGGSLAIIGAAALADALAQHPDNHAAAFNQYQQSFSPVVDEVQLNAATMLQQYLIPPTHEAIRKRNTLQTFG